jgi:peroxiredoxin
MGFKNSRIKIRRRIEIMKKVASFTILLMLLAFSVFAEDMVKDFTFRTIDGKTIAYRSLRGAPLVVNIGAYWCPDCKNEAPDLQQAYITYKDRGVRFLGVFAQSGEGDIKKFTDTFKITFPVGRDNGLAKDLGVLVIPVTLFIDKNGRIMKRYIGAIDYQQLSSNIEAILK